ncbi:hypothetical protein X897_670 [Burkholderia pseudomallei ABCPW 30]|nr:hypothetical protein X897_670 [Burkholderia pseudomallei ABCPW 30]
MFDLRISGDKFASDPHKRRFLSISEIAVKLRTFDHTDERFVYRVSQYRMAPVEDASAESLPDFVSANVEPGQR